MIDGDDRCDSNTQNCDDKDGGNTQSPDNIYIDNDATYNDEYGHASNVKLLVFDSISNNDPDLESDSDRK